MKIAIIYFTNGIKETKKINSKTWLYIASNVKVIDHISILKVKKNYVIIEKSNLQ